MNISIVKTTITIYFLSTVIICAAGNNPKTMELPKIDVESVIILDGIINEDTWGRAARFTNFKTYFPEFGKNPSEETTAYVLYDTDYLYVGFIALDSDPKQIKVSMTNRDKIGTDDWICFEIDAANNAQSNLIFKVNPIGIQEDGVIYADGTGDLSYDMVWESKGNLSANGYSVEMKIPFKQLRLASGGETKFGIGLRRNIGRKSEVICYPEYDPAKGSRLLQRESVTVKNIANSMLLEFNPAVTANISNKNIDGSWTKENNNKIGITGKYGITSDLILDFTYNPDFSHIESDAGQIDINLRSPLFYAEKRPFFLEGRENFSFAGNKFGWFSPVRSIINTRTLGEPTYGLKLNGKITSDDIISAMYVNDEYERNISDEISSSAKIGILRYKHLLSQDSYLGLFATNRTLQDNYNRLFGLDGTLRVGERSILDMHGFISFNKTGEETNAKMGRSIAVDYHYESKDAQMRIGFHDVSKEFNNQLGYTTRTGLSRIPIILYYHFYTGAEFINRVNVLYNSFHTYDHYAKKYETWNFFGTELFFQKQSWIWMGFSLGNEIFQKQSFDISSRFAMGWSSQLLNEFYFEGSLDIGKAPYYDPTDPFQGNYRSVVVGIAFTPTQQFNSTFGLNYIDFTRDSDDIKIYDMTILRSKNTFQFNEYLFVRGIIEFNTFYEKLNGELLISFTYIPGTVLQLGYGSTYDKTNWENERYVRSNNFREKNNVFFFKASYLWRL